MTVGNQLRIQEPTADLLDWCKKNMVLANPDYAKKVRMHLWLGNKIGRASCRERV